MPYRFGESARAIVENVLEPDSKLRVSREAMKTSRETALQLLLGDLESGAAAARLFEDRWGWTTAVVLCSGWGVLPQLQQRLEALGISLKGPAGEKFRWWTSAAFLRSASSLHQGARALSALADAGIEAVAVKGLAAIATLYRGPHGRTIGDVDVLVRRENVEAAVDTLAPVGFRLRIDRSLPAYIKFARKYTLTSLGKQSVSMFASDGSEIDLHWQMGRLDTGTILADARRAEVYGSSIRAASDAHGFLLGVHHTLRNNFAPDRAVRDLLDCHAWLAALLQKGEVNPVIRQAADWGLAAPALAMVQVLARYCPAGPADASAAAFASGISEVERRRTRGLTDLFFHHVDSPWNDDLLYVVRPGLIFDLLRRMAVDQSGYHWLMRTRQARERGALPIWTRLGQLGRSVQRTNWRLLWTLKGAQDRAFR